MLRPLQIAPIPTPYQPKTHPKPKHHTTDYLSASNGANWLKIIPRYLSRPTIDPGDLCSENRGVLGFNLIWLTDKVTELNEELDDMLRCVGGWQVDGGWWLVWVVRAV